MRESWVRRTAQFCLTVGLKAFDRAQSPAGEADRELFRIGVTVSKYFVTKRLPAFTYECMEV